MSRYGLPDYGMYAALENMGNLVDYGELAVRLGSIASFNREGSVIFWDDFEKTPIKWVSDTQGAGTIVVLTDETALSGGQCVKMATAAAANALGRIHKAFPLYHVGKMGFEFVFNHEEKEADLEMSIVHLAGGDQYSAKIKLNLDTKVLTYIDEDSNWIVIASSVEIPKQTHLFQHFKVVIDTEKHEYVRVMLNREEYNIENNIIPSFSIGGDEYINFQISLINTDVLAQLIYIDNVIITRNEP